MRRLVVSPATSKPMSEIRSPVALVTLFVTVPGAPEVFNVLVGVDLQTVLVLDPV
jgi:hypothetical protein